MKTNVFANAIKTKVHNKKITTYDLKDDTFLIEVMRHYGNDLVKDDDSIVVGKKLRGNALLGTIRLSRESLEIVLAQIVAILDFDKFKQELTNKEK